MIYRQDAIAARHLSDSLCHPVHLLFYSGVRLEQINLPSSFAASTILLPLELSLIIFLSFQASYTPGQHVVHPFFRYSLYRCASCRGSNVCQCELLKIYAVR